MKSAPSQLPSGVQLHCNALHQGISSMAAVAAMFLQTACKTLHCHVTLMHGGWCLTSDHLTMGACLSNV